MDHAQLKEHFGVETCPNKEHTFKISKLVGYWRIAKDCWSSVDEHSQTLRTEIISFVSVKHMDGTRLYSLTIFKLKIVWGWLKI